MEVGGKTLERAFFAVVARREVAFATAFLATLLASCGQSSMTGTYVSKSENSIAMVHLVQSQNGALTGRIEAIDVKPDGSVTDNGANLTGVRDGEAVSLSVNSNSILSQGKQVSATIDGSRLIITAAGSSAPLELQRTDMATFLKDSAALRARASKLGQETQAREQQAIQDRASRDAQIANEKRILDQQQQLLSGITDLNEAMDAFRPRAERIAKRAVAVAAGYDRMTSAMQELLGRQQAMANQERFSVQRGQIGVAIAQRATATEQNHNEVESGSRDVANTLDRIEAGLNEALGRCQSSAAMTRGDLIESCRNLALRAADHRAIASKTRLQFDTLETKYKAAAARQAEIQRSSDAIG